MSTFEKTKELVQYATFDAADPTGDLQRKVDEYVWEHLPLTDAQKEELARLLGASGAGGSHPIICAPSGAEVK
jgi:hypothetical protein